MYKRVLLAIAGVSLLAGCGGGGGGSSASGFNGATNQASVTTSNARALSADAYSGSKLSAGVVGVAKVAASGSEQPLLQGTAGILERSVTAILGTPVASAQVAASTTQNTITGFSGSYTYTIDYDQSTGAFSGTMTYTQYKETSDSFVISGSITFSGVFSQATGTFTSMNINMNNMTGTSGGKTFGMSGSISYSTGGAKSSVTMSVILSDSVSGHTYWMKDYTLTLTGSSLSMTGTYYDPVHGYVVISTVTPLAVSAFDGTPASGQLLFHGANGTKARLTFTSGGYTVEADTAGNGSYVVVP